MNNILKRAASAIKDIKLPTLVFVAALAIVGCRFPVETGLIFVLFLVSENTQRNEVVKELAQKVERLESELHDAFDSLQDMNNNLEREREYHEDLESGEVVVDEPPKEDVSAGDIDRNVFSGSAVGGIRVPTRMRARGRAVPGPVVRLPVLPLP